MNGMGAVVLTVQKKNTSAINFFLNKLSYKVSSTSPSKVYQQNSKEQSIPVRVIRGHTDDQHVRIYTYDGLYEVSDYWPAEGVSGYIVYKYRLKRLKGQPKLTGNQYDLELVFVKNSHALVHEYMKKPKFIDLMWRHGALGDGNQDQSTLSQDEWERGQPEQNRGNTRRDRGKMHLEKDDITYIRS